MHDEISSATLPLVSVLVRSMDRVTLDRTLDSVAAQEYPNIEVVVAAACGPAHRDLPSACGRFPLRLIRTNRPLQRAEAANSALDAARGELLNLLDDDDTFLPHHVSSLHSAMANSEGARLSHARSLSVGESAHGPSEFGARFKPWRQLDSFFFHSQAALFARSLVLEGARFDPQFEILEDHDFFVQCAQLTRFVYLERVTCVSYRDSGTSGTGTQLDSARINRTVGQLRSKWSMLERRLHATPEFRLEQAMWHLDHGEVNVALNQVRDILVERPDWPDALALAALLAERSGDIDMAKSKLEQLGHRKLDEDALQARINILGEWLKSRK